MDTHARKKESHYVALLFTLKDMGNAPNTLKKLQIFFSLVISEEVQRVRKSAFKKPFGLKTCFQKPFGLSDYPFKEKLEVTMLFFTLKNIGNDPNTLAKSQITFFSGYL